MIGIGVGIGFSDRSRVSTSAPTTGTVTSDASTFTAGESVAETGTVTSDASTFGISDPTLITSPSLAFYHHAQFTADFTLSGSAVIKWANHAGTAGTNADYTDGGTTSRRPTYTSGVKVSYDGVNNWVASAAFNLNQPSSTLVKVAVLSGAASNNGILDAITAGQRMTFVANSTNRILAIYAAGASTLQHTATSGDYVVGTPVVVAAVFNSAVQSRIGIRGETPDVGATNIGTSNASGVVQGSRGGGANKCNCEISWDVGYNGALTPGQELALYNGIP